MTLRELIVKLGFQVDDKKLKKFNKDLNETKGVMGDLIKLGAIYMGAKGLGGIIKAGADFEQTTIAFEVMLGSAEKAKDLLAEIVQFTKETPFEMRDTVEGAKRLLAYNIEAEKIIPTLTNLGNIAAGVGMDKMPQLITAFGQVKAAGRLTGEELRQFTEAGVPLITALAKEFNVSESAVKDFVSSGKVGFADMEKAIASMSGKGGKFQDLMIRQSKSLGGLFSNVLDYFNTLSIEIGTALLPEMKEIVKSILDWFKANKKIIKQQLVDLLKATVFVLKTLVNIIKGVVAGLGGMERVMAMLKLLFATWLTFKTIMMIKSFFTKMREGLLLMSPQLMLLTAAIAGIILIAEDIYTYTQGGKSIFGAMIDGINKLIPKVQELNQEIDKTFNKPIFNAITKIRGFFGATPWTEEEMKMPHFEAVKHFEERMRKQKMYNALPTGHGVVKNVTVNANMNIAVPEGTPTAQKQSIETQSKSFVEELFNSQLKGVLLNNPVTEGR